MKRTHDSFRRRQASLARTFGDERVSVRAGEGAVNLAHQLHVVEEGVEGVEVGEADHVGGAASCSLEEEPQSVIASVRLNDCSARK